MSIGCRVGVGVTVWVGVGVMVGVAVGRAFAVAVEDGVGDTTAVLTVVLFTGIWRTYSGERPPAHPVTTSAAISIGSQQNSRRRKFHIVNTINTQNIHQKVKNYD
jgi:hypothetical protein